MPECIKMKNPGKTGDLLNAVRPFFRGVPAGAAIGIVFFMITGLPVAFVRRAGLARLPPFTPSGRTSVIALTATPVFMFFIHKIDFQEGAKN